MVASVPELLTYHSNSSIHVRSITITYCGGKMVNPNHKRQPMKRHKAIHSKFMASQAKLLD